MLKHYLAHWEKNHRFPQTSMMERPEKNHHKVYVEKQSSTTEANVLLLYNQWNDKNILKTESKLAIENHCPQ